MPGNAVQIHLWPWSIGIQSESIDVSDKENINFPFYGTPVISFPEGVSFFLDHRYERFTPFGSPYKSIEETHQVCESPNMDLNPSGPGYKGGFNGHLRLQTLKNESSTIRFIPQDARPRFEGKDGRSESPLYRSIEAWSQFFDDIIEESTIKGERTNQLSWSFIFDQIKNIQEPGKQPRMALIIKISESMHRQIPLTVRSARRVLKRKREMVPVDRLAEIDMTCIRWQARQPGKDAAEKAGFNNQALLGIARRESFNTLENRVLKDFLVRCSDEAKRYIKNEVGDIVALKDSQRYRQVRDFQNLCDELHKDERFDGVKKPSTAIQANYVLQNDARYRKVWKHYLKILRKENEKDKVWDWQSRTWSDVARLLINVALFETTKEQGENKFNIEELYRSTIRVTREQHLGSRVFPGSEPGPFFIYKSREQKNEGRILEIVHPDIMEKHPDTNALGRLGGHLYLVLSPISTGPKTIIVVWSAHLAATTNRLARDKNAITNSAKKALANHINKLGRGESSSFIFKGLIIASDLEIEEPQLHESENILFFRISADQRLWIDAIEYLKIHFLDILSQ